MNRLARYAKWTAAIFAILFALLLGSVLVCFGAPIAFGIGSDIITAARPGLVALTLGTAAAILLWRTWRRLAYAAKSMT
jgi:hypothetical protein